MEEEAKSLNGWRFGHCSTKAFATSFSFHEEECESEGELRLFINVTECYPLSGVILTDQGLVPFCIFCLPFKYMCICQSTFAGFCFCLCV